jgi:hypothetical protein
MSTPRRFALLVTVAITTLVLAVALHWPMSRLGDLALGICSLPRSPNAAVGMSVPFDTRFYAGGGEAISPFYRLDFDGRYWSPVGGIPDAGHASTIGLVSRDDLVVSTDRGEADHFEPSDVTITCAFTLRMTPGEVIAWLASGAVGLLLLVVTWVLTRPQRAPTLRA